MGKEETDSLGCIPLMTTCHCREHGRLAARPEAIALRVKRADAIRASLVLVAENPEERVALYRCRDCGATWQGARSRVALFGQEECLYQVPEIDAAEWRREPYVKPADVVLHESALRRFPRERHEELQALGILPRPPRGRPISMIPSAAPSGTHATVARDAAAKCAEGGDAEPVEPVRALA
jgi:hypothetical protein